MRDVLIKIASVSLEFSCKSVEIAVAVRKCPSNLREVSSELHKNKCSVVLHQISFKTPNNLQFPWIK